MKRETINPRRNALARVQEQGLLHAGDEQNPYWNESACYRFTQREIEAVEQATAELHVMCLNAVQRIIDRNLFDRLHIPADMVPYIKQSWAQHDPFIYGRFDLAYDGKSPPKMLEYNADTPTGLLEASLIQYDWMKQSVENRQLPANADQFNFIHESLMRAWKQASVEFARRNNGQPSPIHFTGYMNLPEDAQTVNYMADVAHEAGIEAQVIPIEEIGADNNRFYDQDNKVIKTLFKLYPWEWMTKDKFMAQVKTNRTSIVEPAWKMLLSNKGILPILWEMYPGHPNLLPAYDSPDKIKGAYVKKPMIGREGSNVSIHETTDAESSDGKYGSGAFIYQAYAPLPDFDGHHPIIGAWVTSSEAVYAGLPEHPRGGEACGIGIREDKSRITNNNSQFVPHYFVPSPAPAA